MNARLVMVALAAGLTLAARRAWFVIQQ